ncbi:MAG: hypothetical protein J6D17_01495 [Bacteroides sp.]|nr:hypothetical protein [Bacteroides sp.]
MALANMSFSQRVVENSVEILFNSEYVGRALTLDSAAFTDGVCKAGTPIAANGTVANDATAVGILLVDVHEERPQGTVVIGGYIHTARAAKHSGVTVAEAARAALKNVVFC